MHAVVNSMKYLTKFFVNGLVPIDCLCCAHLGSTSGFLQLLLYVSSQQFYLNHHI